MKKKEIINLIDALFKYLDYQHNFAKAIQDFTDGYVILNPTPLETSVYEMLDEKLPYFYEIFSDFYNDGYDWVADTKELVEIGYYEETSTEGTYKINKEKLEEAKKLPSYRVFYTIEEVFDYYYPDFK